MISKIVGGILLITGISLGAGMLALPVVTAGGGFYHSLFLLFGCWAVMLLGALYVLEVNLWLPEHTNLVSMAGATLGKLGQAVTWVCSLLLLYTLLAAYTSGSSSILQHAFELAHWSPPVWITALLFVGVLAIVLFYGIHSVDWANRGVMAAKLFVYFLLAFCITPYVDISKLTGGQFTLLSGAVMVSITSFGFSALVPTLRTYFKSQGKLAAWSIVGGSLVPLFCYLFWSFVVQGTVNRAGEGGLVPMVTSPNTVSELAQALSNATQNYFIKTLIYLFIPISLVTSFLGIALSLSDFISDGLSIKKRPSRLFLMMITFVPPLMICIFWPGAFILGLTYAGVFCLMLSIVLPALMVWRGRYVKKTARGFRVFGGKPLVLFELIVGVGLLLFAGFHLF